jgi:hypothetical protein
MPRAFKSGTSGGTVVVTHAGLAVTGDIEVGTDASVTGLSTFGTGSSVAKFLYTTTSWDPADLANGATEVKSSITFTGAVVGDPVQAGHTGITSSLWDIQAVVSATNVAECRITNLTGGNSNIAPGTLTLQIVRFG